MGGDPPVEEKVLNDGRSDGEGSEASSHGATEESLHIIVPKKWRVLVTNSNLTERSLEILRDACEVHFPPPVKSSGPINLGRSIRFYQGMDGLLLDDSRLSLDKDFFQVAGVGLKVISIVGWNSGQIDLAAAKKRKVKIGVTPSYLVVDNAAEVSIGLALILARRLFERNDAYIKDLSKIDSPDWYLGQDLKNTVIGILGLGKLGRSIAVRAQGFFPNRIIYYSRRIKKFGEKMGYERVLFEELLESSDVLFLCLPCNEKTRGMFNEEVFMKMKRSSILVNASNGGIVKVNDLYCALRKGLISGAGMNVEDGPRSKHPIHGLANFVLLDLSKQSALVQLRITIAAVENLISCLTTGKLLYPLQVCDKDLNIETEEEKQIRLAEEEIQRLEEERLRAEEEERLRIEEEERLRLEEEQAAMAKELETPGEGDETEHEPGVEDETDENIEETEDDDIFAEE